MTGEIGVACGGLHPVAVRGAAVRQDQSPDSMLGFKKSPPFSLGSGLTAA